MESTKLFNHLKKYGVARTNQFKVNIGLGESLLNKLNGEPAGGGGGSLLSELSNAAGSVFGGVNSTISKAIQVGAVLLGGSSKVARSLSLVCEATALPGVNVSTQEIRMTGAIRKQPYGSLHDDIQFIFLCSGDMLEKKAFDLWIDEVVDKETKLVGFYKDIVSDIQIDQLDSKGNTVYSVVLEEAYPLIVTDMGLVAGETDTIHRINVSFTYRKWRYTGDNSDTKKSYSSFTPFRAIEALQDGNISEAIMSSVKLYNSVKSGNFAGEALAVFDMVDGFLGDNVGISASDADKVLRNIQGDVQLNDRLSIEDKLNLDDVINDIIIRIQ